MALPLGFGGCGGGSSGVDVQGGAGAPVPTLLDGELQGRGRGFPVPRQTGSAGFGARGPAPDICGKGAHLGATPPARQGETGPPQGPQPA